MSAWWMRFPKTESRRPRQPTPQDRPTLELHAFVRLRGKPDRLRRILRIEWHYHRYEYVYIVETANMVRFQPYWFSEQLEAQTGTASPNEVQGD